MAGTNRLTFFGCEERARQHSIANVGTSHILEFFGEEVEPDWKCENCDACEGAGIIRRRTSLESLAL